MQTRILLTLGLLWLTIPAFAQVTQQTEFTNLRRLADVESVALTHTAASTTLRITGQPLSCADVNTSVQLLDDVIVVDVYTVVSNIERLCMPPAFDITIDLPTLETDGFYALLVNDFAGQFFIPRPDASPMDVPAQLITWDEENALVPHWREDYIINETMPSVTSDNTLELNFTGGHNGCPLQQAPLIHALIPDSLDPNLYHVTIFRLHPEDTACTENFVSTPVTITTDLDPTAETTLAIADVFYDVFPLPLGDGVELRLLTRQPLQIETVDITPMDDGTYTVFITGIQSGDCGVPLETPIFNEAPLSAIELFNDIPIAAACTRNLIPLDLSFTVENSPVWINGIFYDIDASSRDDEGNISQVDTVIDSVEAIEATAEQITLEVRGYQPDGCDFPVIIEQGIGENIVDIRIYRDVPADVLCPAMLNDYSETITITGEFSERVTITVNTIEIEVSIR